VKRVDGRDPVVLRGGMGAKALAVALSRLKPQPSVPTVATGPYIRGGLRLARPWTPCSWPR